MCTGGAVPAVGACSIPGGRLFHPTAFAFWSPVPPSQYIPWSSITRVCSHCWCGLIGFWLVRCSRNNHTGTQDPGCYIQIAERASNDRCFLLSLFLQLLGLFCVTHHRSLVCPCKVTWYFQVGEHVSSSYVINFALPTHPAAAWAKALSQFCCMHWHESLHSTTSIFPNIKIAFFVFHWQKWQSLFSI